MATKERKVKEEVKKKENLIEGPTGEELSPEEVEKLMNATKNPELNVKITPKQYADWIAFNKRTAKRRAKNKAAKASRKAQRKK